MSETNTDAMGASLNCRLSSESDTSSVTSAAQTVKIPPPYPGPPGKLRIPMSQLDRHHSQPALSYSGVPTPTAFEMLKQRLQMLEVENRRLMNNQGQLVADTNKRVEMHMREVKSLKDELKASKTNNEELRDLCYFLDDDRQKIRQLSREWQQFGRYTSDVMKQEVRAYQKKLHELEEKQQLLINENDELRRLCLYLDEQRQTLMRDRDSLRANIASGPKNGVTIGADERTTFDSSGCGIGSNNSKESEDEADLLSSKRSPQASTRLDQKQERTLQMITQQLQTSIYDREDDGTDELLSQANVAHQERIINYIHSLESRIRQLEIRDRHIASIDPILCFSGNASSEFENKTDTGKNEFSRASSGNEHNFDLDEVPFESDIAGSKATTQGAMNTDKMFESTSTMTSSGTTFCSSGTDESAEATVFVMGDERDLGDSVLEVRTLGPIDEEKEDEISMNAQDTTCQDTPSVPESISEVLNNDNRPNGEDSCSDVDSVMKQLNDPNAADEPSVEMPPAMAPVSECVNRLSLCSPDIPLEGAIASTCNSNFRLSPSTHEDDATVPVALLKDGDTYNRWLNVPARGNNNVRESLAEAVEVLRVHEMAVRNNMRGLSAEEAAVVQHMCQMAWDSLDRKSYLNNAAAGQCNLKTHMTAV
uniref:Coiled-coil domain-containing protein 85C n=3 Tax=Parascaris univalens TaxID=6257 RepID=A0A915AT25_PARUN